MKPVEPPKDVAATERDTRALRDALSGNNIASADGGNERGSSCMLDGSCALRSDGRHGRYCSGWQDGFDTAQSFTKARTEVAATSVAPADAERERIREIVSANYFKGTTAVGNINAMADPVAAYVAERVAEARADARKVSDAKCEAIERAVFKAESASTIVDRIIAIIESDDVGG